MSQKIELKPCPFCGGRAKISSYLSGSVVCMDCGASSKRIPESPKYCAIDTAVEAWNRRYIIDAMPTIETELVKHGKWEETSNVRKIGKCNIPISKCSRCGFSFCDILNNNELYNYCPNCGAKMDGGENHDD